MCTFVNETFNFTLNPHPNTVARFSLFCGNTERKPFPGLWVFVGNTCVSATLKPPDCPQFSGNDHVSCGSNNTVCFCLFPGNSASSWGEGQAFKDCDWSMFPSARIRLKQFLCVLCRLQWACSEGTGGKGLFAKSRKRQTSHCDFLLQQFVYVAVLTV